jgi:8-oxo-dGTP pyrophosphatase MutT (NUDIX family)
MAVCSYILDKDNHLLLTKRPSWLSIFPNAWVMPGGSVDFNEKFEYSCLREIEEEVGLTIEPKV